MTTNQALVDLDRLPHLFPHGVARAAELAALGISQAALRQRCGPAGPWRQLPEGVVLLSDSKPARKQRLQAALGVAPPGAVITGREAMWLHGIPVSALGAIHLLVADGPQRHDGNVVVERVPRLPDAQWRQRFPVAPLARATVDACLRTMSIGEVRVLVLEAVQRSSVTLEDIHRELARGKAKGSAPLRAVLAELTSRVRASRERLARNVVELAGLPDPDWGVRLSTKDGVHLGAVDAWWPEVGLAWDADIHRPYTQRDDAAAATRLSRFMSAGVIAMHTLPERLREHAEVVARELRAHYDLASRTPRAEVRADR